MSARGRSVLMALATFVPLSLVHGLIEFTATTRFGPSGAMTPIGSPSAAAQQADVRRALVLGLAFHAALWLSLAVPYISLVRSYLHEEGVRARGLLLDVVLRRFHVVSVPWAMFSVAVWFSPNSASSALSALLPLSAVIGYARLLPTLKRTAQALAPLSDAFAWLLLCVAFVVHLLGSGIVYVQIAEQMPRIEPASNTVSL